MAPAIDIRWGVLVAKKSKLVYGTLLAMIAGKLGDRRAAELLAPDVWQDFRSGEKVR